MQVKHYMLQNIGINNELAPKLYFKKSNNNIPKAPPVIEGAISRFVKRY